MGPPVDMSIGAYTASKWVMLSLIAGNWLLNMVINRTGIQIINTMRIEETGIIHLTRKTSQTNDRIWRWHIRFGSTNLILIFCSYFRCNYTGECNADIDNICTPIKVEILRNLLFQSKYNRLKTDYLIKGFSEGFNIGYRGPEIRQSVSQNIPLKIGSHEEVWEKLMKEVHLGCHAGPFDAIPFTNFMQSPIGLVPKAGRKTRLIFHLSYEFKDGLGSLNSHTAEHLCSVKYNNLDHAVANCLKLIDDVQGHFKVIFYRKTDVQSAFRLVLLKPSQYKWLVIKALNPITRMYRFFVDKCLPFGASISCAVFQEFSDVLRYLLEWRIQMMNRITNYLDDFLFIAYTLALCNWMIDQFLCLCEEIGCLINEDKTEWATDRIIFLGILLDGRSLTLGIPEEKRNKALNLLRTTLDNKSVTIKHVQQMTGTLNFLTRAIFPGRAFTRHMYAKILKTNKAGKPLRQFHHIHIDGEFKSDCRVWLQFLAGEATGMLISRPFVDLKVFETSKTLDFYTDSFANPDLGFGCVFGKRWIFE